MAVDRRLIAAGGGAGEGCLDAVGRDVLRVAEEERRERGLGLGAVEAASGKLAGGHVVEAHDEVRRHDGRCVVAGLLRGVDAAVLVAQPVEKFLERANGRLVALEREPRAPELLPAAEAAAHGIERVRRGHACARAAAGGERLGRRGARAMDDDLSVEVRAADGELLRDLAYGAVGCGDEHHVSSPGDLGQGHECLAPGEFNGFSRGRFGAGKEAGNVCRP